MPIILASPPPRRLRQKYHFKSKASLNYIRPCPQKRGRENKQEITRARTHTISLGDHWFVFSIPHSQVYTCMSCTWVILFSFSLSRPLSYSHCLPSHERPSYLTCFFVSRPVCDPLSLIRIARVSMGGSYLLECRWLHHEESDSPSLATITS